MGVGLEETDSLSPYDKLIDGVGDGVAVEDEGLGLAGGAKVSKTLLVAPARIDQYKQALGLFRRVRKELFHLLDSLDVIRVSVGLEQGLHVVQRSGRILGRQEGTPIKIQQRLFLYPCNKSTRVVVHNLLSRHAENVGRKGQEIPIGFLGSTLPTNGTIRHEPFLLIAVHGFTEGNSYGLTIDHAIPKRQTNSLGRLLNDHGTSCWERKGCIVQRSSRRRQRGIHQRKHISR